MKKVIFIISMVFGMTFTLNAQSDITNDKIEQNGDFVVVTFDVETADNSIPKNRKEIILPYLYNGKDTLYLDPLEVYGKNRFKRERQEYAIAGDRDWQLGENQIMRGDVYQYAAQTNLKRWMQPAQLGIKRQMVGCACEDDMPDEMLGQFAFQEPPLPPRRIPSPVLAEASRQWEMGDDELEIIFKVSKAEIDSSVFDNEVTFGKILAAVDKIYSNSNFRVDKIEVAGYASPEGTVSFNKWLGENRAKALINYIIEHRPQYELTPDHFVMRNGEENWTGLRRTLSESDMKVKNDVIAVIDDTTLTEVQKKSRIKAMDGGKVWDEMLKNIYPRLRSARYLAVYYDSSEDNAVEMINGANEMLKNGLVEEGYEQVMKVSDDVRSYNTIGAALMLQGKFEEAIPWFEKALEINQEQARANIDAINAEYEYEEQQRQAREEYLKKYE
ncbi:MAG: tetratricopeptide repeat protein [Bacteroidales bacterium]|nr:tetratricopeptide repeat protein [Bacteroidales bacterium]